MNGKLKEHFPVIRDRDEVLTEIYSRKELLEMWNGWKKKRQEEFLDYCTGVKGVKLLYDHFFKAIINPDATPERLEEILSLILQNRIKILKVLPVDSTGIAAESSLLVLDIVVELEDGSVVNVEVQRIGYAFPGQRSACYSSDLLLRQYKRVKGEKGQAFSYKDIKKVYTIILFEESTKEFHRFQKQYIHRMKQMSDTGIKIDLLQEYVFIALDIFKKILQNKGIRNCSKLEAWLAFLSVDEPEKIIELIHKFPEFEVLYREVYEMCRNMEDFMGLFSEELAILDKNTVDYMIDEMQNTIDAQKGMIDEQKDTIDAQQKSIGGLEDKVREQQEVIDALRASLAEIKSMIHEP